MSSTNSINKAELYAHQVMAEEVLVCEHVRLAVVRYYNDLENAIDKGWYLDRESGMKAIRFIEKLKHTKGELAGRNLILEPWQHFIIYNIFGWKNAKNDTRRFRYAYIEVARKNGKTALSGGVALYMLFADNEARAEVYAAATVKSQAKICFDDAVEYIKATTLKSRLKYYTNSIVYEKKSAHFKPLSSDDGTHDGLNPSCAIIDEFHAHKHSGMFDVLKSAFGARRQPLMFIITTAGFNRNGVCYAYRNNMIKVLQGVNKDESLFGIIYTQDTEDEWKDQQFWIKSNPNLRVSVDFDYLQGQVLDAMNRPEAYRNVITKNLNMWVDSATTWILDETWQKCSGTTKLEDLEGCRCWGGLDLSNTSDVTAFVLLFNENDKFQLVPMFWIPKEKMEEKIRKENINYDDWVRKGYVNVTEGNTIDYDFIEHDILAFISKYNYQSSAYDRWNSSSIVAKLIDEGMTLTPFGQGYASMSAPSKEFEVLVGRGKIEHFDNPVLRWMVSSTVVMQDPAGNIKPNKASSMQKIDGVVATIQALGEYMTCKAKEGENPYATRGLRD